MTDTLGSLAVATRGHYMTGVSVDIGTSFLKPAGKPGDILTAKATLTGLGGCYHMRNSRFGQPFCLQARLWRLQELISQTHLANWLRMDVSLTSTTCVFPFSLIAYRRPHKIRR